MREIFAMFDADGDGKLNKDEYKAYLHGIDYWGSFNCTDARYDEVGWPEECETLESAPDGIGREAFVSILYGEHRFGDAKADLDQCKRLWL